MDAQIKAECFSNQKVIYDYTTGCRLEMEVLAKSQTRHFNPQPEYTSKLSRRKFLWDIVMGGAQALRTVIIQERIDFDKNPSANGNLTQAKDLPFTMASNRWEDSVFCNYRKRHLSSAPKTPITPNRTNRGALKNSMGLTRTIRHS